METVAPILLEMKSILTLTIFRCLLFVNKELHTMATRTLRDDVIPRICPIGRYAHGWMCRNKVFIDGVAYVGWQPLSRAIPDDTSVNISWGYELNYPGTMSEEQHEPTLSALADKINLYIDVQMRELVYGAHLLLEEGRFILKIHYGALRAYIQNCNIWNGLNSSFYDYLDIEVAYGNEHYFLPPGLEIGTITHTPIIYEQLTED